MGTIFDIYGAGDKVPYTNEARNMFAKNALIAIGQMAAGGNLDEVLKKVVQETNEHFQGKN